MTDARNLIRPIGLPQWLASLGSPVGGPVVVVAPHPDDETFALGGLMIELEAAGVSLDIVSVTDGEASHSGSERITPNELRRVRQEETQLAYATLGISPRVHRLQLRDNALDTMRAKLRAALLQHLRGASLCLAPLERDGHPDHEVCGAVAAEVCRELEIPIAFYGVWSRIAQSPPGEELSATRFLLPAAARLRKLSAMACYTSQLQALGPAPEDGPVLPVGFLEPFSETEEILWTAA
jgi:LmbE family N-acetylglucosaminyl deacetylase